MGAGDVRERAGKIQDAHAGDRGRKRLPRAVHAIAGIFQRVAAAGRAFKTRGLSGRRTLGAEAAERAILVQDILDRKSTRLNSSHSQISYAVFCLKKKNKDRQLMSDTLLAATAVR